MLTKRSLTVDNCLSAHATIRRSVLTTYQDDFRIYLFTAAIECILDY